MCHVKARPIRIYTICLTIVLLMMSTIGHGQENRVVKELVTLGTAKIHSKNLSEAKQNAVEDALVNAVGRVVLEMLTAETVSRRFQLINDNVFKKKANFVLNYRVLTESVSGNTIRSLVQVDVAADRVNQELSRLGVALSGAVYPRILFMMAEKNVTDDKFTFWWGDRPVAGRTISETAMVESLRSSGCTIIDTPELNSPLGLAVNTSDEQLLAIAKKLGAEVLITGTGMATEAPNTMGGTIRAFEAVVTAKAFNVRTGDPIGNTYQSSVASGQDVAAGGTEALSKAGAMGGDQIARQVVVAWQKEQEKGTVLEVTVQGTGGHIASLVRLRTAITSISGVRELKMKTMSTDQAVMAVSYQGSSRSLADALLLKTFSGFGIDIYDVTPEAIAIRLVHQ